MTYSVTTIVRLDRHIGVVFQAPTARSVLRIDGHACSSPLVRASALSLLIFLVSDSAVGQDAGRVAKCLSISDIDERIDCLESGGADVEKNLGANRPNPARTGPSFDCRAATHTIERAICGDTALSEWDMRMAQQYQQAMRTRRSTDTQALIDSQCAWIQQRNNTCSVVHGSGVWTCVSEMTKQRMAALPDIQARAIEASPPPVTIQPAPRSQSATPAPITNQMNAPPQAGPKSNVARSEAPSDGPNPLLVILFILGAIVATVAVVKNIRNRERLADEQQRFAAERQRLIDKYGIAITERTVLRTWSSGLDGNRSSHTNSIGQSWPAIPKLACHEL
jgi:uncharacterized protein